MKKFVTLILLSISLAAGAAQAAVRTIKVEVNGMVCAFCAQGIEKKMRALPQTKDVYVNLKHKIVAIELKADQNLSTDTVKDLVKDAGYEVAHIETVDQTAQQIKASIKQE